MKLPELECTAGFYIGIALAILLLPWEVLAAFLVASGFHEFCHIVALRCCHVPIRQIKLSAFGAKIETAAMIPEQELVCAAVGPIASLLLVFLAHWFPILAIFGLCQGLFNLLPIYPMDGGRVVRSIFLLAKMSRCGYNSPDHT